MADAADVMVADAMAAGADREVAAGATAADAARSPRRVLSARSARSLRSAASVPVSADVDAEEMRHHRLPLSPAPRGCGPESVAQHGPRLTRRLAQARRATCPVTPTVVTHHGVVVVAAEAVGAGAARTAPLRRRRSARRSAVPSAVLSGTGSAPSATEAAGASVRSVPASERADRASASAPLSRAQHAPAPQVRRRSALTRQRPAVRVSRSWRDASRSSTCPEGAIL